MSSTASPPPSEAPPPAGASIPALRRAVSAPGVIHVRRAEQHIERAIGFAARRIEMVHRLWSRLDAPSEMGGHEPLLLARVTGTAAPNDPGFPSPTHSATPA